MAIIVTVSPALTHAKEAIRRLGAVGSERKYTTARFYGEGETHFAVDHGGCSRLMLIERGRSLSGVLYTGSRR